MGLATDIQDWLNAPYSPEETTKWAEHGSPQRQRRLRRYLKQAE
jgi:hypothetical protein